MKKIIAILLLVFSFTFFMGCGGDNDGNETINLTMNNYEHYLSFDTMTTATHHVAGSTVYSKKLTVSGAIIGEYVGCVLYYKAGDNEEKSLSLNAAGFGTINYSVWIGETLIITRVTGKIIK